MTFGSLAAKLNLLDGSVGDEEESVTFGLGAVPTEGVDVDTDGDGLTAEDGSETYHWISMSYVLAADTSSSDGSGRVFTSADFFFETSGGEEVTELDLSGAEKIPVQRNYRTDIIGSLAVTGHD